MTPEQVREAVHEQLPKSWLGVTGPLTSEQERDLETFYRHVRHTVDISGPAPCHVEDAPAPAGWTKYAWSFAAGLAVGYGLGRFVIPWVLGV